MNILFAGVILLIGGVWAAAALLCIGQGVLGIRHWRRAILIPGGLMGLVGVAGFFGSGLAASGSLDWLGSYEWPVGHTSGVVRLADGRYVVPHAPTNRVQVYDANLRFLRGWRVPAGGGTFTLRIAPDQNINVYIARGQSHLVYDADGRLLSQSPFDSRSTPRMLNQPNEAITMTVPTHWWLWPLTGPFYGWACAVIFLLTWKFGDTRRRATQTLSPSLTSRTEMR